MSLYLTLFFFQWDLTEGSQTARGSLQRYEYDLLLIYIYIKKKKKTGGGAL